LTRSTWLIKKMTIRSSIERSDGAAASSVRSCSKSSATRKANTITWSWPGTQPGRKSNAVPKTSRNSPTADQIAEIASRGEDVSAYFTNKFTVVRPVRRVNVDLTQGMSRERDAGRASQREPASSDQDIAAAGAGPGDRDSIAFEQEGGLTSRQ
jgi:hypothetical protein